MMTKLRKFRGDILISLSVLPLYLAALVRYGYRTLILLCLAVIIGFVTEFMAYRLRGIRGESYGFVCWLLFPLFFPPAFPLVPALLTIFFALLIGTALFGGHGKGIVSPISIGLCFAVLSFNRGYSLGWVHPFSDMGQALSSYSPTVVTVEHPVDFISSRGSIPLADILSGYLSQPPANALPGLLIVIILLLVILKVVDYKILIATLATTVTALLLLNLLKAELFPAPLTLLSGHFLPAAALILADKRYSPRTEGGKWLSGLLTGLIAVIIISFSAYGEGIFFAIIITNISSSLIDEGVLYLRYNRRSV